MHYFFAVLCFALTPGMGFLHAQSGTPTDATPVGSGNYEIDSIRTAVRTTPTTPERVAERRDALYRWWRLLWRQGVDMGPFDPRADVLVNTRSEAAAAPEAVDAGFATLEELAATPYYVPEVRDTTVTPESETTTDWPFYHSTDGSQTGYSPDPGPATGRIAWKFPKTNGWDTAPVLGDDGRVYASGGGSSILAFCFEERTGELLWKGKQSSEAGYYYGKGTLGSPQLTERGVVVGSGRGSHWFDRQTGAVLGREPLAKLAPGTARQPTVFALDHNSVIGLSASDGRAHWHFSPPAPLTGSPTQVGVAVYLNDFAGTLYRLDAASGKQVWAVRAASSLRGSPTITPDLVIAGTARGELMAFSNRTGKPRWTFTPAEQESRAFKPFGRGVVRGDRLYVGAATGFVYCIDLRDGSLLWKHAVTDWVRARPVLVDELLYVATLDGTAYALRDDGASATELWRQRVSDHGVRADLVGNANGILVCDENLRLHSLAPASGTTNWIAALLDGAWIDGKFIAAEELPGQQSSPTVVDSVLYIAGPDGFLHAIAVGSGEEVWKFETGSRISPSPTVAHDLVFIGESYESYGRYFALDRHSGEVVWSRADFGDVWIAAVEVDGLMFAGNMAGDFFAFDPRTGAKEWEYFTGHDTPKASVPDSLRDRHGWPPGVYCNPVVEDGVVYTGSWSGYYFAFEQRTGRLLWRCKTQPEGARGGLPDSAAPTLHKGHLYVQRAGRYISAIDKQSGEIVWDWEAPRGFLQNGTVAAAGDMIYGSAVRQVTDLPYNATVFAFSDVESGGTLQWSHRGGGGLTAPVLAQNKLVFGSSADPFVTCLDARSGAVRWRTRVGGMMLESVPTIYGDRVYALIKNGYLYAIE